MPIKRLAILLLSPALFSLLACRSNVVSVSITNQSKGALHNLEFQYPSATFGKAVLAPDESYRYKVKITADGELKLKFVDPSGREHNEKGPLVSKNANGQVDIGIDADSDNNWKANFEMK